MGDIPIVKKITGEGILLKELVPALGEKNRISAIVPVPHGSLKDQSEEFVVLVTADGLAKKTLISKFSGVQQRSKGIQKSIQAIKLDPGDKLRWAHKASAAYALAIVTDDGWLLRTSLGKDWAFSAPKAAGKPVIRLKRAGTC